MITNIREQKANLIHNFRHASLEVQEQMKIINQKREKREQKKRLF